MSPEFIQNAGTKTTPSCGAGYNKHTVPHCIIGANKGILHLKSRNEEVRLYRKSQRQAFFYVDVHHMLMLIGWLR